MSDKIRDALKTQIEAVAKANSELLAIDEEIARLDKEKQFAENRLKLAIGGRDALASVWLPEDLDLGQAWRENFQGLQKPED